MMSSNQITIPDSFVLIYGGYTPSEKLNAISRIKPECGLDSWKTLFTNSPNVVSYQDTLVVFNDTNASITIYFEIVEEGAYEISIQCLSPTKSSAYCQLDDMPKKVWYTARISDRQTIFLYTAEELKAGVHTLTISYLGYMGLINLMLSGSQSFIVPVINTFLYPNRRLVLQLTNRPDIILPAINTQLYGTTSPPFTGSPIPNLSCYETATPQPGDPYIILYGSNPKEQKIRTVQQISTYCGRSQWETLIASNPNIISGNSSAIILNNPEATINIKFWAVSGSYNIFLRCILPSANTNSGYVRLDNMPEQEFTRGLVPLEYSSQPIDLFLFQQFQLTDWFHELVFSYKEPIGYIEIIISRADARLADIVIPVVETLLNPDKIFGDKEMMVEYMATLDPADLPTQFKATGAGPKITYTYAPLEVAYSTPIPKVPKIVQPMVAKKVYVKPVPVKKVMAQKKKVGKRR